MRNFPTYFWQQFQDFKERIAFVYSSTDKATVQESFWEWTQRVQKLALGLMDAGFTPNTRLGILASNSAAYMDLCFASWLIGGCIVPVADHLEPRDALRQLARAGCHWIVVERAAQIEELTSVGPSIPDDIGWIVMQEIADLPIVSDTIQSVGSLLNCGRSLFRRGKTNQLAERTYNLSSQLPAVILYDAETTDPNQVEGAYYTGEQLVLMLDALGKDLLLPEDTRVASSMNFGWFSSFLIAVATLLQGRSVAFIDKNASNLQTLKPTHIICRPDFLEKVTQKWEDYIEKTPDFLKKLSNVTNADEQAQQASTIQRMMSQVGQRATKKLLYEPLVAELGGSLHTFLVFRGPIQDQQYDIFEQLELTVLTHFGIPETGVSHIERKGAQRRHSVGRPLSGYVCKIKNGKGLNPGPVVIRGDTLFSDYWRHQGPRQRDADGWLDTGVQGSIESGYLFLMR